MIRKIVVIAFFLIAGFCKNLAFAQTDTLGARPLYLKISLQHLLINGLHVDIEKPHKYNKRRSLVLSPRFYSGRTHTVDLFSGRSGEEEDNAQVLGFGAEIQQRWYLSTKTDITRKRTYVAYGLNLHHFAVAFEKEAWVEETASDGLAYYQYRMRPYQEKIYQWGAVAMFGAQNPLSIPRTILDIFVGVGYHNSHGQTTYHKLRYNQGFMDYGYTGFYFLAGLKLGLTI